MKEESLNYKDVATGMWIFYLLYLWCQWTPMDNQVSREGCLESDDLENDNLESADLEKIVGNF